MRLHRSRRARQPFAAVRGYQPRRTRRDRLAAIVGVNDRMQVAGQRVVNGVAQGFLWESGTLTDLPCLPRALNAKGQVACEIPTDTGTIPALWDNGTLTPVMQQK